VGICYKHILVIYCADVNWLHSILLSVTFFASCFVCQFLVNNGDCSPKLYYRIDRKGNPADKRW